MKAVVIAFVLGLACVNAGLLDLTEKDFETLTEEHLQHLEAKMAEELLVADLNRMGAEVLAKGDDVDPFQGCKFFKEWTGVKNAVFAKFGDWIWNQFPDSWRERKEVSLTFYLSGEASAQLVAALGFKTGLGVEWTYNPQPEDASRPHTFRIFGCWQPRFDEKGSSSFDYNLQATLNIGFGRFIDSISNPDLYMLDLKTFNLPNPIYQITPALLFDLEVEEGDRAESMKGFYAKKFKKHVVPPLLNQIKDLNPSGSEAWGHVKAALQQSARDIGEAFRALVIKGNAVFPGLDKVKDYKMPQVIIDGVDYTDLIKAIKEAIIDSYRARLKTKIEAIKERFHKWNTDPERIKRAEEAGYAMSFN